MVNFGVLAGLLAFPISNRLPAHNDGAVTSDIRDFPASCRIGTTVAGQLPIFRTWPKPIRGTEFPFHPVTISMLTGHQNDYGKELPQVTGCKVEKLKMRVKGGAYCQSKFHHSKFECSTFDILVKFEYRSWSTSRHLSSTPAPHHTRADQSNHTNIHSSCRQGSLRHGRVCC